jgi:hypothetical protein
VEQSQNARSRRLAQSEILNGHQSLRVAVSRIQSVSTTLFTESTRCMKMERFYLVREEHSTWTLE